MLPARRSLRHHPLLENRPAPLQSDAARRFQQAGERLRRLEKVDGHVRGFDERLVEHPEPAGGLVAIAAGEEQRIGAVRVR